jgi:hypothetical protein
MRSGTSSSSPRLLADILLRQVLPVERPPAPRGVPVQPPHLLPDREPDQIPYRCRAGFQFDEHVREAVTVRARHFPAYLNVDHELTVTAPTDIFGCANA